MNAVLRMTGVSRTHGEGATLVHALVLLVGLCTRSRLPLVARID